MILSYL